MNRLSDLKRKRPEINETPDGKVLTIIKRRKEMAIWIADLKKSAAEEFKLPASVVDKAVKSLVNQDKIKEVVNIKAKTKKHFIAKEFEPSEELTGGVWYSDGKLDKEFISVLRQLTSKFITMKKVANAELICDYIKSKGVMKGGCTVEQISEILSSLVLDNEIIEVKSTGLGEFHSIPLGMVCYKSASGLGLGKEPKIGAMASIPCGVCPQINKCTPDGLISPITCEYYQKWLEF